jgi:hypothetical protein
VKHIAHLLNTANLIANQNKFANEIVPEATTPLEYSVLTKLDLGSEELETIREHQRKSKSRPSYPQKQLITSAL